MIKSVRAILVAVALALASASTVSANPLAYSTPGIVGTFDGKLGNSNPTTELGIAQQLLDLIGLGVSSPTACTQCYRTSTVFDYSATLANPVQGPTGARTVPLGYDYVLAKYDGPNAGYVLYFLPTFGTHTLPQYPANFWTTNPTKWAISHYTTFDDLTVQSVPDGGPTMAPLGIALAAMAIASRRVRRASRRNSLRISETR